MALDNNVLVHAWLVNTGGNKKNFNTFIYQGLKKTKILFFLVLFLKSFGCLTAKSMTPPTETIT